MTVIRLFLAFSLILVPGCAPSTRPVPPSIAETPPPATPQSPVPTLNPTPTPTPEPLTGAPPLVNFLKPVQGATLPSGTVDVAVTVANFNLVPPGTQNTAGQGHIHYYLDVSIPTVPGQVAFSTEGTYKASSSTSVSWNLSPGTHTLGVQLVNNDHTPLNPPVVAQVIVTISAPEGPAIITIPPVEVKVSMKNFLFIPAKVDIYVGDKVTWVNDDIEPHTVTTKTWDSGTIGPGQSYSRVFDTSEAMEITCVFHPTMIGQVVVNKRNGVP